MRAQLEMDEGELGNQRGRPTVVTVLHPHGLHAARICRYVRKRLQNIQGPLRSSIIGGQKSSLSCNIASPDRL